METHGNNNKRASALDLAEKKSCRDTEVIHFKPGTFLQRVVSHSVTTCLHVMCAKMLVTILALLLFLPLCATKGPFKKERRNPPSQSCNISVAFKCVLP